MATTNTTRKRERHHW